MERRFVWLLLVFSMTAAVMAQTGPGAVLDNVHPGQMMPALTANDYPIGPDGAQVPGEVMASRILVKTNPVYPQVAKDAHVQGTVTLHVLIGTDGKVTKATVMGGPVLLQGSALQVVPDWTYKPLLLNGVAVPVDTVVKMQFSFGGSPPAMPGEVPSSAIFGSLTVSGGEMEKYSLTKVNPVYPAEAKAAGIGGVVLMNAVVNKKGVVTSVEAISGPPELRQAAIDAVKQWTYRPHRFDDKPVEVKTQMMVGFKPGQ